MMMMMMMIVDNFQIWNKKEHNIIIWRVIRSQIGPSILMGCLYFEIFEWFCLQISSDTQYFLSFCLSHSDRGLTVVIVYCFYIWNKKGYNIIISSVIRSYIGPMYWDTLYIHILHGQK